MFVHLKVQFGPLETEKFTFRSMRVFQRFEGRFILGQTEEAGWDSKTHVLVLRSPPHHANFEIQLKNKAHAHSCRITKATNRHTEHAIPIDFPQQQWLRERTSIKCYMHSACLVKYRERNGYRFCVCMIYMNGTALRHTCHSNTFI